MRSREEDLDFLRFVAPESMCLHYVLQRTSFLNKKYSFPQNAESILRAATIEDLEATVKLLDILKISKAYTLFTY